LKIGIALEQADEDTFDKVVARNLVDVAWQAALHIDTTLMRRNAAIATKNAAVLERKARDNKAACWRAALAAPAENPKPGPAIPSKLAYRWIRGEASWTKSPVGPQEANDDVPDEDDRDDVPAHLIMPATEPERLRMPSTCTTAVLSDQADVEAEAEGWAALWDERKSYDAACDPVGTEALQPLLPWALRQSSLTFPIGTGCGADNISPRAFARLSGELITTLCVILTALELLGDWPTFLNLVVIVLLPKPDGGRRPIGLFPAVIRLWARARAQAARAWEAMHAMPGVYGGAGMGAQRAAWQAGFKAENAALAKKDFAHSLLDLVKAFERVPHGHLIAAARKHDYNLWLLRLSLKAYRIARVVAVEGVFSRTVVATCGITAGSCFATTELRLLLVDVLAETYRLWPAIDIALCVDDATLAATGFALDVAVVVAGATDTMVDLMEVGLGLQVSVAKSVTAASRPSIAECVRRLSVTGKLKKVITTKMLGAPSGGGRRRAVRPSITRVRKFAMKGERIRALRSSRINVVHMVRAAGTAAVVYGAEVMGFSDTHLHKARTAIATAVSPASGGKNPDLVLLALDSSGGCVDPAFEAHVLPVKSWALAHWQHWQADKILSDAFFAAARKIRQAKRSVWDAVAGPAAAVVATLWRLGWTLLSATRFVTDSGGHVDVTRDSPAAVALAVRDSVRRWQFAKAAAAFPHLIPDTPDAGPEGMTRIPQGWVADLTPPATFRGRWPPDAFRRTSSLSWHRLGGYSMARSALAKPCAYGRRGTGHSCCLLSRGANGPRKGWRRRPDMSFRQSVSCATRRRARCFIGTPARPPCRTVGGRSHLGTCAVSSTA